jgi:RNA polymerase sigma factor (sigma-70 family)
MPGISTQRARWLAINILPLESQLRGWLKRVTPPGLEIDDLIQEAYSKLAGLESVENITQPKAYLYQIVKRLISDHLRRASVVSIDAAAEIAQLSVLSEGLTPERILSGRQELERLYQAIAALPGPCKAVFIMRKFDDKSQKLIAAELKISENVVEKRMARALRILLNHLQSGVDGAGAGAEFGPLERKEQRDG